MNLIFRMKQRNFRDVEYLKKSQKDISDKINGALDEVLTKQKSSTRPISAPSKGSFIMKAAAQARFPIFICWTTLGQSDWRFLSANRKPTLATVSWARQKTKATVEKARHESEIDSSDTCRRSSQTRTSKNAFWTLLFVWWWKSYFWQRRSHNKMWVRFQPNYDVTVNCGI